MEEGGQAVRDGGTGRETREGRDRQAGGQAGRQGPHANSHRIIAGIPPGKSDASGGILPKNLMLK